ncbi:CDP-glycerol:glycerophosphate glycerophosphotransferase [Exiguobacterium sp. s189]|uniref:CDP-glycerol:glycerophosphate glycerophosphotransferase n=1 Tax=Exiguobacterium sp. s189 TaxID=2751263 RepID=UPI001BEAF664|nr:CDP-glycerol glycerophosphotransferase family protein [Exiguobacterium sp. s189]
MQPILSVIITNFNKGDYIAECFENLPLKNHLVEIIAIDDCSTDFSKEYLMNLRQSSASSNLHVILNSNNMGVSACRNLGLEISTGRYVTFIDADDYISFNNLEDTLKKIGNNEEYSLIIGNIQSFNKSKKWFSISMKNIFNDQYEGSKTINENPELHLTPSVCNKIFLKKVIDQNNLKFDTTQHIGEDLLFVQTFYQYTNAVFVTPKIFLNYRVLEESKSLSRKYNLTFFEQLMILEEKISELYLPNPENAFFVEKRQINYISTLFYKILSNTDKRDFLKFATLIKKIPETFLNFSALIKNKDLEIPSLFKILELVSIEETESILQELSKYGEERIIIKDGMILSSISNVVPKLVEYLQINNLSKFSKIEKIKIFDGKLILKGYFGLEKVSSEFIKNRYIVIKSKHKSKKKIYLEEDYRTDLSFLYSNNKINYNFYGFKEVNFPLNDFLVYGNNTFSLEVELINGKIVTFPLEILTSELKNNIRPCDYNDSIYVPKFENGFEIDRVENTFLNKIDVKLKITRNISGHLLKMIRNKDYKTLLALMLIFAQKLVRREKKIWIIAERKDSAQDNSFHLFKYIRLNHPDVPVYYLIEKQAKDYGKVKDYGNVITFDSLKHTLALLNSKISINSYLETANMYSDSYKKISKIFPKLTIRKKVFLQHGVIGFSRLNHVLHKNRAEYDLFITSSKQEMTHIIEEYGYSESEVIDLGLVRWDELHDQSQFTEKKQILLMPTWRHWIHNEEDFVKSDFWAYYRKLMDSEHLAKVLESNNAELIFFPHYLMKEYINAIQEDVLFDKKYIKIAEKGSEVKEYLEKCTLLITDYSSVSYDVNYLNKPVLFCPFDYDRFFSEHYNKGPRKPGEEFGISLIDEIEIISAIQKMLQNNDYAKNNPKSEKENREIAKQTFERISQL